MQPTSQPDRAAIVDLLGVLAYGELSAFDRMAADARMAPTTALRAALSEVAALEMGHYRKLVSRLAELGADPQQAMAPFVEAVETFHRRTEPRSWGEALVKAYVGDGLAADFYLEIAQYVDESTRQLVTEALADSGNAEFAIREVRALIAADPTAASRLSLWARRLVGEAITQAQRVAADRDALTTLIMGGVGDLTGIGLLTDRIMGKHTQRMAAIGLSN
ncbi:ferritin-like fold-containing protein [Jatrophihabitans sp.]|uniref:ferritin-like fold-containing protein n=1 Tax=Jatrophihabitans sp. TaxID=1932789 RepID=UPI002BFF2F3F|nr:ferritin-like fold-containing protein [Jatrophihabitans sp.]